ncbi:MAG: GAF domain-containing protein [Anaerolineae bacterium]|nr:GAF domain-containing protein [Anaerolineae bacterium]
MEDLVIKDASQYERTVRLLQTLNQASLAMAQALTPDAVFKAMSEALGAIGFSCVVFLLDEDQEKLRPKYLSYSSQVLDIAERLMGVKVSEFSIPVDSVAALRIAVRDKKITFIASAQESARQIFTNSVGRQLAGELVKVLNISKFIAIPLLIDEQVLGVFSVQSMDLNNSDIPALTAFANQMAFAWHKAQLYHQAQLDLAERERMTKALTENEERVSQILQGSAIPIFVIDTEHYITHWNLACERLTGLSEKELLGTNRQWSAFYKMKRPIMADLVLDGAPESKIAEYYGSKYKKSVLITGGYEAEDFFPEFGTYGKWVFFTAAPLRNSNGETIGAIESLQDITERRFAEEEVKWLARFPEENPAPVLRVSNEGLVLYANAASQALLATWDCQVGYSLPEKWCEFIALTLESGTKQDAEVVFENRRLLLTFAPIVDANYVNIYGADVTERVIAQEETRRRATQQESLNAIIAAATATSDLSELLETALDLTLHALGVDIGAIWVLPSTFVIRGLPSGIHIGMRSLAMEQSMDILNAIAINDWATDSLMGCAPSPLVPVMGEYGIQASITVPLLAEGRRVGGLSVAQANPYAWSEDDVALVEAVGQQLGTTAERLRLLGQIREQAQRMNLLMDAVPEGVLLLDAANKVVLANPVAQGDLKALAQAQIGDTLTYLGDHALDSLLTSPPKGLWHEVLIKAPSLRVFEIIARPIEAGDENQGWVMVLRDVTREREIKQRVQQQERLAAVGQLAAGIAHDFNNLMAVIVLYVQMALRTPSLPLKTRDRLKTVVEQAKRATELIQQILDFSRNAVLERQPLNLIAFLKEQVKLLRRTLPENIQVELTYNSRDTYMIHADPTRIQQVIMNLSVNARDAMPEGGLLNIELSRVTLATSTQSPVPDMAPGEWVLICVSDTGCGIPSDFLPRIFDPFVTSKPPGKGSGLGLAQVHGIVKQHAGEVLVESQVGQGTTFNIYLPILNHVEDTQLILESKGLFRGQGQLVLVVEDDTNTREALTDSLSLLNYRVVAAENGVAALAILEKQAGEIALILSDVVMPKMGGVAMLHAMHKQGIYVPVVMLTGHPLDDTLDGLRLQGMAEWIAKPPTLEKLSEVLYNVLAPL